MAVTTEHQQRIESKSIPVPEAGCWIWTGGVGGNGYGRDPIGVNGRPVEAHRSSFIAFHGNIPSGLCICHRCDTPTCVNPDHLFAGTRSENMRDMYRKGRRYGRSLAITDTRCGHGHDLTGPNGYHWQDKVRCRECNRVAREKYKAKRRALAAKDGAA
jgi:hypothetical protein